MLCRRAHLAPSAPLATESSGRATVPATEVSMRMSRSQVLGGATATGDFGKLRSRDTRVVEANASNGSFEQVIGIEVSLELLRKF